ncbi:hypothetical protein [Microbispora sp. NPDC049125]|uniref:hypothetical protein n=1 Tax=Microbispora sp. NPDC049125 TaxID=3154929 RepID=UPI0034667F9B
MSENSKVKVTDLINMRIEAIPRGARLMATDKNGNEYAYNFDRQTIRALAEAAGLL